MCFKIQWDTAVTITVIIILVCIVIYIAQKNRKDKFQQDIWNYYLLPGLLSIIVVLLILIFLSLMPESKILDKLSDGDVIVGMAIAAPTLYSWRKADRDKKEETEIILLRSEYFKWLDDISEKNNINLDLVMRVKLDTLLSKNDKVKEGVIDYTDLFIAIQNKIVTDYEGVDSKEWRRINTLILNKLKDKDKEEFKKLKDKIVISKSMKKLKYIDFTDKVASELLSLDVWPDSFEYSNCLFNINDKPVFSPQTEYKSVRCIFDDFEEFKMLCLENNIKFKIENYYLEEAIEEAIEEHIVIDDTDTGKSSIIVDSIIHSGRINNKLPEKDKTEIQQKKIKEYEEMSESKREEAIAKSVKQSKEKYKICDRRNFGLGIVINEYLVNGEVFDIVIDNNENSENNRIQSINSKIISKVKQIVELKKEENVTISRSLSFIPSNIKDNYSFYSYNILSKNDINESTKYIIFAVQCDKADNKNFKCLIFDIKNFKDLYGESYKNIRNSETGRWHFIFVEKKELMQQISTYKHKYIQM